MSVALVTSVSSMLVYTSQASAELLQPQFFPSGNFDNCTDYYADNGIWVVWGGGVPLTGRQMTQYAYGAGFRGTALRTMVAIAWGESHYCPRALNSTSDEYSIGLWQINTKSTAAWNAAKANCGPLSTRSDLYDPAKNAKCAKWKYNIQGFTAWSIYNNGYYRNQMAFADQWADFLGY